MLAFPMLRFPEALAGPMGDKPESEKKSIDKVLEFFGFRHSKGTALLRGSVRPQQMDVWRINIDGTALTRLTADGGYAWPIVCGDGRIVVLHGTTLRVLRAGAPPEDIPTSTQPSELLACKDGVVGAFVGAGGQWDLVLLDLRTGRTSVLAERLTKTERHRLSDGARTCDSGTIFTDWPNGINGRAEIGILPPDGDYRNVKHVTSDSLPKRNAEPTFSPDCKQVVFVAPGEPSASRSR